MKKFTWTVSIILAVLIVLFLVLPYPMGYFVEKRYKEVLASAMPASDIAVRLVSYDRGWFASTAVVLVDLKTITRNARNPNAAVWRTFKFKDRITHGPIIFDDAVPAIAQASLHGQLELSQAQRGFLGIGADNQTPIITREMRIEFSGASSGVAISPPAVFKRANWTIDWKGFQVKTQLSANLKHTVLDFNFAGLTYTRGTVSLSVGPVKWGFDGSQHAAGIWVGTGNFSLASINVQTSKFTLKQEGITNRVENTVQNGTLSSTSQTEVGRLWFQNQVFGPGAVDFAVKNIDVATLEQIQEQLRVVRTNQVPSVDQRVQLAGLLLALLNKGLVFQLNKFHWVTPWGALDANGQMTFQRQEQPQPVLLFILRTMQASYDVQVPARLATLFAQQYYARVQPKEDAASRNAMAQKWLADTVQQGYLIKQGDVYKINVTYQNGRLLVNGKPLRLKKKPKLQPGTVPGQVPKVLPTTPLPPVPLKPLTPTQDHTTTAQRATHTTGLW